MFAAYDVFLSHAWADGDRPQEIAEALREAGLRVWFDAAEIKDFTSITRAVTEALALSKTLLDYYSKTYPLRRACQWELTAAFLAAQAEGDPLRRVLVVSPEEKADHILPIALKDAKLPTNDGTALHDLVESVVKHVAVLDGPLADIHPLSAPNWYGMAPAGSTRFVGRLKEMWEVHSLLHAGDVVQVSYAPAPTGGIGRISGLGGVGKSLLAEEYALHFGSAYPGGVFWLRAHGNDDAPTPLGPEQREAMRTDQVRQMAERLGIDTHGKQEQVEGALARKIASVGKPCLWVVDDVPNGLDGQALRRWFAPQALARTLITTRSGEYGSLTKGIDLSVLARDEAYQLLTSRRVPTDVGEQEQAGMLTADLGYHALALDVTGAALVSFGEADPYRSFRVELERKDVDALELAQTLADVLPNGHDASIAHTLLRSISSLGAEGQDLLRLASVLAGAPIPASLVTAVFEKADNSNHSVALWRQATAFNQVTKASLAEVSGTRKDQCSVHTLVSRATRFSDREPARTKALRGAAAWALAIQLATAAGEQEHETLAYEVEHARAVVLLIVDDGTALDQDEARSLLGLVRQLDRHDEKLYVDFVYARDLRQKVFEISKRVLGEQDFDTVTAMNDLAVLLYVLGELSQARVLQEKVLRLCRLLLGEEHVDTLTAMMNLLDTLVFQGDQTSAQALQERVNEIGPRVWATGTTGMLRHNPP